MKTHNNIISCNNHNILLLYPDKYQIVDTTIDVPMSSGELNNYLSYVAHKTTNENILFFYIKHQNSYSIFLANKLYIEKLAYKYTKTIITPLPVFYQSLFRDSFWAIFNINKDTAFVVTNISNDLKIKQLPISLSEIKNSEDNIVLSIIAFIGNIMPHIDKDETIKNIYFDSNIDDVQKINGEIVYKDVKIKKLDMRNFNLNNLEFNFAKIKNFRFYFLLGLLLSMCGIFFSANAYLEISNDSVMQNIKLTERKHTLVNKKINTIKTIKKEISIIEKNHNKQIVSNSNFSDRIFKFLSSQNSKVKTIIMDENNSYAQ